MKPHLIIINLFLVLAGLIYALPAKCDGGHDHSHGEEMKEKQSTGSGSFSSEVSSDKYELLLRYTPIEPGHPAQLILFVSDYETNKPVNEAEIKITAQEDPSISFTIHQDGN